jgi:predicted transcriptional regulator
MASVSDTLSFISNDKSLILFNIVALGGADRSALRSKSNLTRKQYYSRILNLTNAGLIKRNKGRYSLTSLGKVVYEAHLLIGQALEELPKLRAIDSIESSEFPASQLSNVINTLIINEKTKEVLISRRQQQHDGKTQNEIPYSNEQFIPCIKPP